MAIVPPPEELKKVVLVKLMPNSNELK